MEKGSGRTLIGNCLTVSSILGRLDGWQEVLAEKEDLFAKFEIKTGKRRRGRWQTQKKAFPLDPLHLQMSLKIFNADRPHAGVHIVFEDSLPDDWGRRLMARRSKLGRNEQRVPQLLQLLGNQGLGALSYGMGDRPYQKTSVLNL